MSLPVLKTTDWALYCLMIGLISRALVLGCEW
jgi:hypothetical protein